MSDGEALLRAIIDEPGDDLHRLAFADWLDEQGEVGRAEFVRVQLAAYPLRCDHAGKGDGHGDCYCVDSNCRHCMLDREGGRLLCGDVIPLRPLTATPEWEWLGPGLRAAAGACEAEADCGLPDADLLWWVWRRGLVERVRCPLAVWMGHGPAIVRDHPVGRVRLTDHTPRRRPFGSAEWHGYAYGASPHAIPRELFFRLAGARVNPEDPRVRWYRTQEAALDALSVACLSWAREKAGPLFAPAAPAASSSTP